VRGQWLAAGAALLAGGPVEGSRRTACHGDTPARGGPGTERSTVWDAQVVLFSVPLVRPLRGGGPRPHGEKLSEAGTARRGFSVRPAYSLSRGGGRVETAWVSSRRGSSWPKPGNGRKAFYFRF